MPNDERIPNCTNPKCQIVIHEQDWAAEAEAEAEGGGGWHWGRFIRYTATTLDFIGDYDF